MTLNIRYLLGIAVLFSFSVISAQVRTSYTFEKGWKFTREDNADFIQPDYNDIKWQSVVVPHDWAIYGPFGVDNDRQMTARRLFKTDRKKRWNTPDVRGGFLSSEWAGIG